MTAVETPVLTEWGVRHSAHIGGLDRVDLCPSAAAAERYCNALHDLGGVPEAELMERPAGGGWRPIGGWSFPDRMLTAEVAALFGVDRKTVARWADLGRLTVIRTPGRSSYPGHRRFSRPQVEFVLAGGDQS